MMFEIHTLIGNRAAGGVRKLLAGALVLSLGSTVLADGVKAARAAERDVVAQLAGDRRAEAELQARLEALEARLKSLEHELQALSETLEGLHRGDAGRRGERARRAEREQSARRYRDFFEPAEAHEEAREKYRDAKERWREEWQEHREDWRERQAELMDEWREQQQEWQERWREEMGEWREQQREATERWREELEEMREHGAEWAERFEVPHFRVPEVEVPEIEMPEVEIPEIRIEAPVIEFHVAPEHGGHGVYVAPHAYPFGDGEREQMVYEVTGKHADWLYKLLAPADVKVIVSRAGKHIAIAGTDREHEVLRRALELLNWIERDDAFEWMTKGERQARRYELGSKRADAMYEMLAPSDVKVIVSRAGDEAVSVQATDREHQVLSDFLVLLNWKGRPHHAPEAAHERALKKAEKLRKEAETKMKQKQLEIQRKRQHAEGEVKKRQIERELKRRHVESGDVERKSVVYDVTGKHADWLYKLLAPDYVKVIVSRAGENIRVEGTKCEHSVLDAGLQLLNWIDRDDVFEKMTHGERHSERYELGEERADHLYKMLAPNDVKVIVSRAGEGAVSVQGTKREHEVLSSFLALLGWMDKGEHSFMAPEARVKAPKPPKAAKAPKAPKPPKAPKAERQVDQVVFEVTGKHADMLYKLLAPNYVKAIVSRAGENIAVRGTDFELDSIRAFLELVNWIDREDAFEKMTKGERSSRVYGLGEERADLMYEMLAPSDVLVIVGRAGPDAVSIQATEREHKVLHSFLKVLHWELRSDGPEA